MFIRLAHVPDPADPEVFEPPGSGSDRGSGTDLDPDPDPPIIKQKSNKTLDFYCIVTSS
jgi:hypothetical protein